MNGEDFYLGRILEKFPYFFQKFDYHFEKSIY